jgi:hypothetical protein
VELAYLSVELECGCAQVHQAEEQRKVEQDARTLYIRFNKTYPSSHDEIKVRYKKIHVQLTVLRIRYYFEPLDPDHPGCVLSGSQIPDPARSSESLVTIYLV